MHYYERNIGDYHRKAGRLNILQHGVYTLLIDACYDREKFPTLDEAIDWVWAMTDEEIEAVKFVLRKFFTCGEDGVYTQNRIQEDLNKYKDFCAKQAENGKKGGRPKGSKNQDNSGNCGNDLGNSGFDENSQENPSETQNNPNEANESQQKPKPTNHLTNKPSNQDKKICPSDDEQKQGQAVIEREFEKFWNAYPKKQQKKPTFDKFKKINFKKYPLEMILSALEKQKESPQWQKENGQFIPMATTWIYQERWNDQIELPQNNQSPVNTSNQIDPSQYVLGEDRKYDQA
ncbi:YdaU family protein [Acinetobacter beijerinckii]|uniref:YdaU family protein n=1 Tax=Acinetobacter beijerinckii TaxID=262668 RepID=UPI003AF622EB